MPRSMGKTDEMYDSLVPSMLSSTYHINWFFLACWENDPHKRPMFKEVLRELKQIAKDGFIPHESFHTIQDGWKKEIAEVLHELRLKEKVCEFLDFI